METPEPCEPDDSAKLVRGMIIVSSVFVAWFVFVAYVIFRGQEGAEAIARFGDAFGVINAGFSSLAAAGAVYAVILQSRELRAARDDAKQSRLDSARSIAAQEGAVKLQARTIVYQEMMATRERNLQNRRNLREKLKEVERRLSTSSLSSDGRLPGEKGSLNARIAAIDHWLGESDVLLEAVRAAIAKQVDIDIDRSLDDVL